MNRSENAGYAPVLRFPSQRVRASDAEREEAVSALREHHAAGRLDLPEFVARMEAAQDATYVDELPRLFHDLPRIAPRPRMTVGPVPAATPRARWRRGLRIAFPVLLVLAVLNLVPWWVVAVLVAVATGLLIAAIPVAMVGGAAWLASSARAQHYHRHHRRGYGWS